MSARLLSFRFFVPATFLAGSALLTCQMQAAEGKPSGRAIEIPESAISEVASNLHQLNAKQNRLKRSEEDPFKSLKRSFSPENSLEAVLVPPTRSRSGPPVLSKKAKEQIERQKNWAFMSPDELAAGPTMEEIFNIREYDSDGHEKKKRSAVEIYYESLDRQSNGETNSKTVNGEQYDLRKRPEPRPEDRLQEETRKTSASRESEQPFRKLFESDPTKSAVVPSGARGTPSDIFGLGENKPSPEWAKTQKAHLDEFKQLLALPALPPANGDSLKSLPAVEPVSKPWKSLGGLDSSLVPARPAFELPGGINPFRPPAASPDFTSGFGQPSLTPALPNFEPFKPAPPPANFGLPKRSF